MTHRALSLSALVLLAEAWAPGIPTGWETAPASVGDFPNSTADPWLYSHRLGLYKLLLSSTPKLHYNNSEWANPIWGLPLQFSWQHDTGRLASSLPDAVNSTSWWGNMNYILSVVPFVAALDAGLIPDGEQLQIKPPPIGAQIGCVSYSDCAKIAPNATAKWAAFMRGAKAGFALDEALEHLWEAHLNSLHEGLPRAEPLSRYLGATEAQFGVSWANLVDFVAAMQFYVSYNNTNDLQGMVVPPRILRNNDTAPFIKDFSGPENRALLSSAILERANRDGSVLKLFQRLCCTSAGRSAAYDALTGFLAKPLTDFGHFIRVLVQLIQSHPC